MVNRADREKLGENVSSPHPATFSHGSDEKVVRRNFPISAVAELRDTLGQRRKRKEFNNRDALSEKVAAKKKKKKKNEDVAEKTKQKTGGGVRRFPRPWPIARWCAGGREEEE